MHVPDTNVGGYLNFNRFYYAQVGKQAAVIDERYNHGGQIADYIVDELKRPLRNCLVGREGEKSCSPQAQIYGPKTMIINEMSGSGGDALPWMFRQDDIGPLVGTRTWGGLVGIGELSTAARRWVCDRAACERFTDSTANGKWRITASRQTLRSRTIRHRLPPGTIHSWRGPCRSRWRR